MLSPFPFPVSNLRRAIKYSLDSICNDQRLSDLPQLLLMGLERYQRLLEKSFNPVDKFVRLTREQIHLKELIVRLTSLSSSSR